MSNGSLLGESYFINTFDFEQHKDFSCEKKGDLKIFHKYDKKCV